MNSRILVVNADIKFLTYVGKCFKLFNIPFMLAETGSEAVKLLNDNNDINTIICGINLKDITGISLIKHIKEKRPDIAAIFCSDYKSEWILKNVEEMRATFWDKSTCISNPEIFENINRYINHKYEESIFPKANLAAKQRLKIELPYYYFYLNNNPRAKV